MWWEIFQEPFGCFLRTFKKVPFSEAEEDLPSRMVVHFVGSPRVSNFNISPDVLDGEFEFGDSGRGRTGREPESI